MKLGRLRSAVPKKQIMKNPSKRFASFGPANFIVAAIFSSLVLFSGNAAQADGDQESKSTIEKRLVSSSTNPRRAFRG